MKFTDFSFHPDLMQGIEDAGFEECMPVQEQTFQEALQGRDILAQSQTGTGKTAAFLISLFQIFLSEDSPAQKKALIVVPTRELAVQIKAEADLLGKHLPFSTGCFYGGIGYAEQNKLLEDGVDIAVGTPGRLLDYNKGGKLDFRDFGFVIIDEADRLFDMGFLPDLQKILKRLRPPEERRMMLFSATLRSRVRYIAWEHMNDPAQIEIEPEQITVDGITQELYHVGREEKMPLLLGVLQRDTPENCLIFTNTRHMAWEVARRLEINGYRTRFISGDLPQKKRLEIIESVKEGKEPILVATDVAARGLHIDELDMVVNYDLPMDSENYVHRIGRTARAGRTGKAVSLACESFVYGLQAIESYIDMKIPVVWPEESLYGEDASAGMSLREEKRNRDRSGDRGRRDNRDSRGRRDGREGRSRDGRGRRDRNERRSETRRSIGGERRPLDGRAAKVQSQITELTGSAAAEEGASAGDSRGSRDRGERQGGERQDRKENRSRGRRDNRPGRRQEGGSRSSADSRGDSGRRGDSRGGRGESGRRGSSRGSDSRRGGRPVQRIDKSSSPEERLAYYRAKYGEDFEFSQEGSRKGGGTKPKDKKPQEQGSGPSKESREKKGLLGLFRRNS